MVESPILFITFARPDYARKTWDAIKAAKPKSLYFYSNKGREEKEGELERNEEIRSYIKEINWDCDLHTWFRDKSVDVYESVQGAISWLFDNEEQGVILEEDCVPSLAFFDYCDKLLPKYSDDYRIWIISGDNYYENEYFGPYDYFFAQDMQTLGWASWKSRWNQVDWEKGLDIDSIIKEDVIDSIFRTSIKKKVFRRMLKRQKKFISKTRIWDSVFLTYGIMNNSLSIVPAKNLIENIGLEGMHNRQKKRNFWNVPVTYTNTEYVINSEPLFISPNLKYDDLALKKYLYKFYTYHYRLYNKIKLFLESSLCRVITI